MRMLSSPWLSLLAVLLAFACHAQQVPDPEFDASVARPAYQVQGPTVVIDEAHLNFHTAGERYRPFAQQSTVRPERHALVVRSVAVVARSCGCRGVFMQPTP